MTRSAQPKSLLNCPPPPLRQRLKEAAALAMLDAAEETLIARGFENSTMQDVAARAGCAVGTLYLYFKNKEEFFKAILQRRLAEIHGELTADMAKASDPLEQIRVFVEVHIRWAHKNVKFVNMMCSAMPMRYYDFEARMREMMPDCKDEMRDAFIATVRAGQKQGLIRKDVKAEMLADVLHGVMVTLLDQFSARPEKFPLKEQLTLGWQFIATGLVGSAGGKSRA